MQTRSSDENSVWQSTLDRGGAIRALLVDFKKAIDPVNHNLLLRKLLNKNVPHCRIKWFFSYLDHRVTTSTNRNRLFRMAAPQWCNAPRILAGTIVLLSAHRRLGCRLPNPQVCRRYYLDRVPVCPAPTL